MQVWFEARAILLLRTRVYDMTTKVLMAQATCEMMNLGLGFGILEVRGGWSREGHCTVKDRLGFLGVS